MPKRRLITNLFVLIVLLVSTIPVQSAPQNPPDTFEPELESTPAPTLENENPPYIRFLPLVRHTPKLPTIIPETTEVLPPETTQYLTEVSPDRSTYTFDQSTPALDDLQEGSIMVSGIAPNAPEGFLRKVTSVSSSGTDVIIQTEPATLEEAITQGSYSFTQTLTPDTVQSMRGLRGVSMATASASDCAICFNFSFNNVVLYQDLQNPDFKITANGNVELEVSFNLSWEAQDGKLTNLTFSPSTQQSNNLTVKAEWKAEKTLVNAEVKVYQVMLSPIVFMAGPVPVVLTPIIDVFVGLDGSISLSLETGVNYTQTLTSTLSYSNGTASVSASPAYTTGFISPKVAGELELKAYVSPAPTLKLYGVAGPWIKLKGYLKGIASSVSQPTPPYFSLKFGLYIGFEVPIGVNIAIFSKQLANMEQMAFKAELLLHEWSFLPPNPPSNPGPADGAVNQGLSPVLSWTCSDVLGDTLAYDVYFKAGGSDFGFLPVAKNITTPSYSPGALTTSTQYYWKVLAHNTSGATSSSSVWTFSTLNGPIVPGEMITIPAGSFSMGCDPAHNGGYSCASYELPLHIVYLDAYRIDKYEVTNAQYARCVADRNCTAPTWDDSYSRPSYYNNPAYSNYPVIAVSWQDATNYCAWAGKRLPTEAEWEKAGRGISDTRAFPWGDASPTCNLVNGFDCIVDTNEVGSYPAGASPYGVMDMAGNVWEWVNDWYSTSYYSVSPYSNPQGPANGEKKVLRGGGWGYSEYSLRIADRYYTLPTNRDYSLGFRCAAPPP